MENRKYFRTVIKDIQGDVLWDVESFSPRISKIYELHWAKINREEQEKLTQEKRYSDSIKNVEQLEEKRKQAEEEAAATKSGRRKRW